MSFHLIISDPTSSVLGQELPALVADGYSSLKVFMTYEGLRLNDAEILKVLDVSRETGAKDGGRIVSIGTTGAVHIPFAGAADYVATKAAVAAYARGWARDLGARGITVNVIQPGAINTDMNPEDGPFAEALKNLAALGRYGQPEDIAAAVAFLVGPDAGYITGATLNVEGGQSA